jgi:uncharacterized protein (DUF3084 family)
MNSEDFENKFTSGGGKVLAWAKAHGKATAVIIAVIAGMIIGAYFKAH